MQELNKIEFYVSSAQQSTIAFLSPGSFHGVSTVLQGLRILCIPSEGTKRKGGEGTHTSHIPGPQWYSLLLLPFRSWDFITGLAYMQRRRGNVAPRWKVTFQKQRNAMKGEARTLVDSQPFSHPKQIRGDGLQLSKSLPWDENVQEGKWEVLWMNLLGSLPAPPPSTPSTPTPNIIF